jgi:hypothetical protein
LKSTRKDQKRALRQSLSDDQIVTVELNRRSFLSRVGLVTAAVSAAAFSTSCGSEDDCDLDPTDDCDTDGT